MNFFQVVQEPVGGNLCLARASYPSAVVYSLARLCFFSYLSSNHNIKRRVAPYFLPSHHHEHHAWYQSAPVIIRAIWDCRHHVLASKFVPDCPCFG